MTKPNMPPPLPEWLVRAAQDFADDYTATRISPLAFMAAAYLAGWEAAQHHAAQPAETAADGPAGGGAGEVHDGARNDTEG